MSKKASQNSEDIEVEIPAEPDYKELYIRLLADVENTRRHSSLEKQQFAKFALAGAVESLLPVVDNFYRATEHVPAEQKDSAWLTGIMYIQKQLMDVLESWGVEEIATKPGDVLNPEIHEAIGIAESSEIPEDHIVSVQTKGYRLQGKVIRPAAVITSKNHQ